MLLTISPYYTETNSYEVMKNDVTNSFFNQKNLIQQSTNELINLISTRSNEIELIKLSLESIFIKKDSNFQIFLTQKEDFIIVYL